MEKFLSIMEWLRYNHAASLGFGVLSAILWIKSATAKVQMGKKIVMVTYDDPTLDVNLHDFFATARLQARYNSFAALSAAATALFQIVGW